MPNLTLEAFADPILAAGGTYDFGLRPADVPELAAAATRGTNCIVVAHHVAKLLGRRLPTNLLLTELYSDRAFTSQVRPQESLEQGDFMFLGSNHGIRMDDFTPDIDATGYQRNWHENPLNHLVVATGYTESDGDPIVVHAAPGVNTELNGLSALQRAHEKYAEVHAVRRLRTPSLILPPLVAA